MIVTDEGKVTDAGFKQSDLEHWNKCTMVNSVVYRCTELNLLEEKKMRNIDALVMILGRPNFQRSCRTGGAINTNVEEPTLLILNGWCHMQLRAQ